MKAYPRISGSGFSRPLTGYPPGPRLPRLAVICRRRRDRRLDHTVRRTVGCPGLCRTEASWRTVLRTPFSLPAAGMIRMPKRSTRSKGCGTSCCAAVTGYATGVRRVASTGYSSRTADSASEPRRTQSYDTATRSLRSTRATITRFLPRWPWPTEHKRNRGRKIGNAGGGNPGSDRSGKGLRLWPHSPGRFLPDSSAGSEACVASPRW